MTRKRRRLWIVLACGLGLSGALAIVVYVFNDNLVFFVSPSELSKTGGNGRTVRLGGLVEPNSVIRGSTTNPATRFRITDGANSVPVTFNGILPDLFREGQGVVTLGKLRPDGVFVASEVLAKHDENYMPKEVADALKKSGHWNPASGAPPPASTWNTEAAKRAGG